MTTHHDGHDPIADLAQPESLLRELERALRGVSSADAAVALRCGENVASVCARGARFSAEPPHAPIRIGCIAKLLTATLAMRAFDEGLLAPDCDVGDLLGRGEAARALRGITARQLLDHAHGLDDSLLDSVPRREGSRVDVEALVRALHLAPALAQSGDLYSYGSAGAWLTAALLERGTGRSYSEQVRAKLFAPLDIRPPGSEAHAPICPATGAALALDPTELLRVVAHIALQSPSSWPDDDRPGAHGTVFPLPGWNPLERGVYLGWKYHGRGWFGHQSLWPAASLFVRAHPSRALALVVASRRHSAAVVAARVLGAHLPELFDLRVPVGRTSPPPCGDAAAFASAAWHVEIRGRELCVRRRGSRTAHRAVLSHIGGGVSFVQPVIESFPHVEVVARGANAYLWNGRFVLRGGVSPASERDHSM